MYQVVNVKTNSVLWSIQKYDAALKRAQLYMQSATKGELQIRTKDGQVLAIVRPGGEIVLDASIYNGR